MTLSRNTYIQTILLALCALFAFTVVPVHAEDSPPAASETEAEKEEEVTLQGTINAQARHFAGKRGAGYGPPTDARIVAAEFIRRFLTFIGTLFVVYTVYGGYLYMTAAGRDDRIEKSKSILTHGVIGVLVIFFSYSLAYFVVRTVFTAQGQAYVSYFKWGVVPGASDTYDPLKGYNDPLGGSLVPDLYSGWTEDDAPKKDK